MLLLLPLIYANSSHLLSQVWFIRQNGGFVDKRTWNCVWFVSVCVCVKCQVIRHVRQTLQSGHTRREKGHLAAFVTDAGICNWILTQEKIIEWKNIVQGSEKQEWNWWCIVQSGNLGWFCFRYAYKICFMKN